MDLLLLWGSYVSPVLGVVAVLISALAYRFAKASWQETHRPIVICRVETHQSGNVGEALKLVVANEGTRPATRIRLATSAHGLSAVLLAHPGDPLRQAVERCFSNEGLIPILTSGERTENSFGYLSPRPDSTWKPDAVLEVSIEYEDLNGRTYHSQIPLRVRGSEAFAGSLWELSTR